MDHAERAALAVREWSERLDRAQSELALGATVPPDSAAACRLRQAIDRARPVIESLGRGEEAIRAEFRGQRSEGTGQALEHWAHRASAAPRRGRPRRAEWRDVAPTVELIAARQARDAVLRLGVWSVLGDAIAALSGGAGGASITRLLDLLGASSVPVPPGIAPTLAYAGTADAQAFFNGHLRGVLERIDQRRCADGARLAAALPPMDRTAALAQRWSHAWSNAACTVYADWLQRRGDGSLEGARLSLWQFNEREGPVRFRPADGLTVIPTKGYRLHVDLWLQPVLAQVLAYHAERWQAEPVDGRWHPVRLAIHDLTARDVGDSAEGSRTLFRGLSVEMLYQALFIDRVSMVLRHRPAVGAWAGPERRAAPVPVGGPQLTRDAAMQRIDGGGDAVLRSRGGAAPALVLTDAQRRAFEHWRAGTAASIDPDRLDWRAARDADAEGVDTALLPVGHVDLWGSLADTVAWLDFGATARLADGWVDLPLELVDEPGPRTRTWLALQEGRASLEALGVSVPLLRRRLGDARRCSWMCRDEGLGAFVTLAVDLREPR